MNIKLFFLVFLVWLATFSMAQTVKIEAVNATELLEKLQQQKGVVVVNFWSTWCKPCIEEIPHFLQVYNAQNGDSVQLWLVSQDTKDLYHSGKLKDYISKKDNWSKAKLLWFNETNADYYCPLVDSSWSGVIPATLIVNPAKGYRKFFEETMSAELLSNEILKAMK
jgi:thiol-disulfide isomerase/thioredoxin